VIIISIILSVLNMMMLTMNYNFRWHTYINYLSMIHQN